MGLTENQKKDIEDHNLAVQRIEEKRMPKEFDGWARLALAIKGIHFTNIDIGVRRAKNKTLRRIESNEEE